MPKPNNNWKFVPEAWTKPAAQRDYELLFGKKQCPSKRLGKAYFKVQKKEKFKIKNEVLVYILQD